MRVPTATQKEKLEIRKLELDVQSAEAALRKTEAEARQAELTKLLPDLSKIVVPELATHEGQPGAGTRVTYGALEEAADKLVKAVAKHKPTRVLVTSDPDLATADSVFQDINSAVTSLSKAATDLLPRPPGQRPLLGPLTPLEIAAMAATVIPQAVSLLLPKRTIATSSVAVDDLAACAEVIGALLTAKVPVVHDDFQMLADGGVYKQLADLQDLRRKLTELKLTLVDAASATEASAAAKERVAAIDSVTSAIDTLTAAARASSGGARSALATAALYERLHGGKSGFSHVLLVKSQSGSASEHREDLPLWSKDKFTVIVDVHLTFMLLETGTCELIDAGTSTATAVASGSIGSVPSVQIVEPATQDVGVARSIGARPYVS